MKTEYYCLNPSISARSRDLYSQSESVATVDMVILALELMVDAGSHLSLTEVVGGGQGGGEDPGDHGDVHDEEQLPVHHRSHRAPCYPPN